MKKDFNKEALKLHKETKGKWHSGSFYTVKSQDDLATMYSPGVGAPCMEIARDKSLAKDYTIKGRTVAIISNGTAVLGLGDIGPEAAMPVMEGKAILLQQFGGLDAIPLCIDAKDPQKVIEFCKMVAPSLGAINLEDIKAPECVTIERTLIKELNIPVFHDDQHGTAIVTTAALINAAKLTGKDLSKLKYVVSGTGAAGNAIIRMIHELGAREIYATNSRGPVNNSKKNNFVVQELLDEKILKESHQENLAEILVDADVFIGVSMPGLVTKEMIRSMNDKPWVFAMANPVPEIMPEDAIEAGAYIVGTGRSDYPNQINNLLAFPGIFAGVVAAGGETIDMNIKMAAARAIANAVSDTDLKPEFVVPKNMDPRVHDIVKATVKEESLKQQGSCSCGGNC